jgi:hypothetical protein
MLTVDDLDRQRADVHRVNHETYKGLLAQVQDHIRARAANGIKELVWQVPPLVLGRPVYKVDHAARYVSDKLRIGGFVVQVVTPSSEVSFLHISWASSDKQKRRRPRNRTSSTPAKRPGTITTTETSRRVEQLKAHLRLL